MESLSENEYKLSEELQYCLHKIKNGASITLFYNPLYVIKDHEDVTFCLQRNQVTEKLKELIKETLLIQDILE